MRTVIDHNLSTRAARQRLPTRKKPYFRAIDVGTHIGYGRRQERNGTWVGRVWLTGKYETDVLGEVFDYPDRGGTTYSAAVALVREWARSQRERTRLVAL